MKTANASLLVYCAASVEPAITPIAAAFTRQTGISVNLETGPSGPLVEKLRRDKRGDLYIPAAGEPFLERCRSDGTVTEIVPLASLQLVLAVNPSKSSAISLKDLLAGKACYALAHEESAAGLATLEAIAPLGDWQAFAKGAQSVLPTVTEVAKAVRDGAADCGITWDATAKQYGLTTVELPELAGTKSTIAAGVLASSPHAAAAKQFAAYVAAADKGGVYFKLLGYSAVES